MREHLWITVLAGGVGSRFWPVSTPERPKQLLPLGSDQSLISDTVRRALGTVDISHLRILAGEHLVPPFRSVLPDLPLDVFMVEPQARGTGPVLAWAAHKIARTDPDAIMVSLHSDHVIHPPEALRPLLMAAAQLARREDALFTVSAKPDRAETGYGYLRPGTAIHNESDLAAFRVEEFVEKPDEATARAYIAAGHLWNTGMFVWPALTFLEEIRRHSPEISGALHFLDMDDEAGFFQACESISVDEAVLERSNRVATVLAPFAWDDVGSWEALARTRGTDPDGNTLVGGGEVIDGSGNIVYCEAGRVVLWGVHDLVVVETAEVSVVMPRDRAPRLKELLAVLPSEGKISDEG